MNVVEPRSRPNDRLKVTMSTFGLNLYHAEVHSAPPGEDDTDDVIHNMTIVAWTVEPYCHGQTRPTDEYIGVYLLSSTHPSGQDNYHIGVSEVTSRCELLKTARITLEKINIDSRLIIPIIVPGRSQEEANDLFRSFYLGMCLGGFRLPGSQFNT